MSVSFAIEESKTESQGDAVSAPEAPKEDAQVAVTEESKVETQVEPSTEVPKDDTQTVPVENSVPLEEEVKVAPDADTAEVAEVKEGVDESPKEHAQVEAKTCDVFGTWCKA